MTDSELIAGQPTRHWVKSAKLIPTTVNHEEQHLKWFDWIHRSTIDFHTADTWHNNSVKRGMSVGRQSRGRDTSILCLDGRQTGKTVNGWKYRAMRARRRRDAAAWVKAFLAGELELPAGGIFEWIKD